MDKYEKLEALLDDAAVQQELESADSVNAMLEVLKNHGVEISEEELQQMVAMVQKQGELSDTDLDDVAGGVILGPTLHYKVVAKFVVWVVKKIKK